jgi:hypothetical protein
MTTLTTATVLDHSSDAGFRAWGAEVAASLTSIGLTQTSDTGQINFTTVTRAAANAFAGYQIWAFNDTLQTTSPVYIKIQYGTGAGTNYPVMTVQTGTGSNGSGTLTGATTVASQIGLNQAPASTSTTYTSRYCYNTTAGFLGVAWKYNAGGISDQTQGGFFISRSNSNTGVATGTSVSQITGGNSTTVYASTYAWLQTINFANALVYPTAANLTSQGNLGWGPWPIGSPTTSASGNVSVLPTFYAEPDLGVSNNIGQCLQSEVAFGSTISVALVGSTANTYLSVGRPCGNTAAGTNNVFSGTLSGLLMLWQ